MQTELSPNQLAGHSADPKCLQAENEDSDWPVQISNENGLG